MLRLPIIILWFISFVSVVQAADIVVIRSDATELFSKGQLLDSAKPVNLPEGVKITVVFATGGVQTVTGPFQGKLNDPLANNEAEPKLVTDLSRFLTDPELNEEFRASPQPLPENLWWVNVGTKPRPFRYYCIAPSSHVILWRSKNQSQSASTLLIKHKGTGEKAKVVWPAYQQTLNWPDNLPVYYGQDYTVKLISHNDNDSSFKILVLYQLPKNFPTKSHKVVWMVGRGCIPQANMLLASLR